MRQTKLKKNFKNMLMFWVKHEDVCWLALVGLAANALYIRIYGLLLHIFRMFIRIEYQCVKMNFPSEVPLLKWARRR